MTSRPHYLTEVAQPIRDTLCETAAAHTRHNVDVSKALMLILREPATEKAILAAFRAAQVRQQVPEMVQALQDRHSLSFRLSCHIVGLFVGYHGVHVQRLCYQRRRACAS